MYVRVYIDLANIIFTFCLYMYITLGTIPPLVSLTSNLNEERVAYDGQTVIFTCNIQSTGTVLSWSSNEYIGLGTLQFASIDSPGQMKISSSNSTTVATLINTTTDPDTGVTEMVSELQLIALIQYSISSISCRINSHGRANTTSFLTQSKKLV